MCAQGLRQRRTLFSRTAMLHPISRSPNNSLEGSIDIDFDSYFYNQLHCRFKLLLA